MLVPKPIAKQVQMELSFLDWIANPTIWVQHPIKAAAEAKGDIPPILIATQIATEDIGAVKAMPTSIDTNIHIKKDMTILEKHNLINSPIPMVI